MLPELSERQWKWPLAAVVLLGIGLRSYYYAIDLPMWHDEAAQAINVLFKDVGEYTGPLYFAEASPPLFMMAVKGVVGFLGDSTWALRLVPYLASCLSLLLLVAVARSILSPSALWWFALALAVSDRMLWHAAEVKSYAVDMLIAAALAVWMIRFDDNDQDPARQGLIFRFAIMTALTPPLFFLSFSASFLLGGLSLAMLPAVWRHGRIGAWAAYVIWQMVLVSSFVVFFTCVVRTQAVGALQSCWHEFFPDWSRPWSVPATLIMNILQVGRYALDPIGQILVPLAIIGSVALWRSGRSAFVLFAWTALILNAAAWIVGRFPLGAWRVNLYLAPMLLLLAAVALPSLSQYLRPRVRWAVVALILLMMIPVGEAAYRLVVPWRRLDCAEPARFILARRQADEPVIGGDWEDYYYFRSLGPQFRLRLPDPLCPPTPPATMAIPVSSSVDPFAEHAWYLHNHRDAGDTPDVRWLPPAGQWHIEAMYRFKTLTACYLRRSPS